ncbi:MAG: proteasome activator, partial [Brevibacterium aurantiacum]
MISSPDQSESASEQQGDSVAQSSSQADVSSPAKVMRIGTMVKQLLEEVRSTDL